jgi:hypothetical protein
MGVSNITFNPTVISSGRWSSSAQSGGSTVIASPMLSVDFNGLTNTQSVVDTVNDPGSTSGKRFDSVLGNKGFATGYGVQAVTDVKMTGKTSSCAISIANGSDGDPSGGDTGTIYGAWGGTINLPTAITQGNEFWYGMWCRIPAAYDWNSGIGVSKPGYIKFLRVNNSVNGQRIEHHVINGSWNGNAAADNLQIGWTLANEFDPKAQEETHKGTDKIMTLGDWHWVEFYIYAHSDASLAKRRIWVDEALVFERVGADNKWRDINGIYQTETLSSGEKSLPTSGASLTSVMHGTYWNGYSPQNQTYHIQKIVAHNIAAEVLAADSFGNKMMGIQ